VVELWLPRAAAAVAAPALPPEPLPPRGVGAGCSLLLVDDDALPRLATAAAA
jgi:hypothetical protein